VMSGVAAAPAAANHNGGQVTICHRTAADNNPYVVITPDEAAVDGEAPAKGDHYLEHQGPVWNPTLKAQHIEWGDIIPPVPGHHEGLNWTAEGQAIYRNGCTYTPPTTVPPTTDPPTTTTAPPPPTTAPPTTEPPTTAPPTTTVTLPPLGEVLEPLAPVVEPADELPRTGSAALPLVGSGLGLILVGAGLLRKARTI
jgi:hypothetical protein